MPTKQIASYHRRPLHLHAPHYFARHLSLGLEELYVMVGLNDLALSAIMVFEPIYLFSLGLSLSRIAFFYFFVYLGYVLLVPLGGMVAARLGYPRTILLSTVCLIAYYASLFGIAFNPDLFWAAAAAFAVQKSLYWPAFESDFVRFTDHRQEGKELSGIVSLSTIVTIIGPLLGGLLVKFYGFPALFGTVIGLILISNAPLFFSKNPATREPVGYWASWQRLFASERRRAFFGYTGFAEELIVLVFWPIAMFLVIRNFAGIGLLTAGASLATVVIALYIGKLIDQHKQASLIRFGSLATSITWLARTSALITPLVFVADTLSRLFKTIFYVPLLELTLERAAREGPLKTTVFFEQSLALGKMLIALLFFIVFQYTTSLTPAFIVAAGAALLYPLLAKR